MKLIIHPYLVPRQSRAVPPSTYAFMVYRQFHLRCEPTHVQS